MNHDFILGPVDTDSISICKPDMSPFSEEEQNQLIEEINSLMPELIKYAHDGYYDVVCALKAKNYILYQKDKGLKLKGSSLKDGKKEAALKEMISKFIDAIIFGKQDQLITIYESYIKEAFSVKDISRWCAKKTITKPVLACVDGGRTNELKVWNAVKHVQGLQEGDKVYLYPCILSTEVTTKQYKNGNIKHKVNKVTGLRLMEEWNQDEDKEKLMERVIDTVEIFANIIPQEQFINYSLVKNKEKLDKLLGA